MFITKKFNIHDRQQVAVILKVLSLIVLGLLIRIAGMQNAELQYFYQTDAVLKVQMEFCFVMAMVVGSLMLFTT